MTEPETTIDPPSLQGLIQLSHYRWMVPLIANIGLAGGERFASLLNALQISGPSLRRVVDAAIESDLLMLNPGYGHPLRPEFLLTPWGECISTECAKVMRIAEANSWTELATKKWSLPVLAAINCGNNRYSEISQALPASNPRAIAKTLDELTQAKCVQRKLLDQRPPRPSYSLTKKGNKLAEAATALATASSFC